MKKILAVSLLTSLLCGGCALFGGDEGSSPATAAPAGDPATTETAKAPEKAPAKAAPVSSPNWKPICTRPARAWWAVPPAR